MRALLAALAVSALAGCGTQRFLENRLACTADGAMVVSMWGVVGIASDIRAADAERACTR